MSTPAHLQPEVKVAQPTQPPSAGGKEEFQRKPTDHLYWARTSSSNAPPPKQITAEEAAKLQQQTSSSAGGSAWNKGGSTWEEKDIKSWAHELLKTELLTTITYNLPTASATLPALPADDGGTAPDALYVRVLSADKVSGECTYVLSRGKQRVVFELDLKLKLEIEVKAGGQLQTIVTGTLHVPEVTNDDLSEAKLPSAKTMCDQPAWKPGFEFAAKQSWPALKESLETLVERAKDKWR